MLNKDYSGAIQNAVRNSLSLDFSPIPNKLEQLPEVLSTGLDDWNNTMRKQAYENALKSGNQEEIDKALAEYNPEAYANVLTAREQRQQALEDAQVERDFKKELLDLQTQRALQLEGIRQGNAMKLAEFKEGLKGLAKEQENAKNEEIEQQSKEQAQNAINQLYGVADRNNIGVFTDWRRKHGLTGKETEQEYGLISSAVAGIAPRAISKLKAAGVTGINSLPEFMTYVGLPQNPTSQQIMGALPMMAEIAGVENPIKNKATLKNFNTANAPLAENDPLGLR